MGRVDTTSEPDLQATHPTIHTFTATMIQAWRTGGGTHVRWNGSQRRKRICGSGAKGRQQVADAVEGMKWDADGLVCAIAQHVDTGAVLMQAFTDRAGLEETLETGLATFYSRSRQERWCKGETSGNFIKVASVHVDCDKDSVIYLGVPIGPACHTGAETCYFNLLDEQGMRVKEGGVQKASSTMFQLEETILERKRGTAEPNGGKPSWTAKLLANPELACKKVREEADELCRTWEDQEGRERTVSEMADLLYHAMTVLAIQGVQLEEVNAELRRRFGVSGVEEKATRSK